MVANAETDDNITTISNKAFVLLLLEKNWDWWMEIYRMNDGKIMPNRGRGTHHSDCTILPMYTWVGTAASSHKDKGFELGKRWTNEGIEWFNTLFDKVKADCKANPGFVRTWIAKEHVQLQEQIKNKDTISFLVIATMTLSHTITKGQWTREEMEASVINLTAILKVLPAWGYWPCGPIF